MQAGPDRLYGGDVALTRRSSTSRRVSAVVLALAAALAVSAPGLQAAAPTPEVRIPFPEDDGSLTPYTFQIGYPLVTLVYDTLMWRGTDGTPQPWLARSVRRDQAGKRVTIRLRGNVRWHDGKPLTARDVAFTFGYFAKHFHPRFTPQLEAVKRARALDAKTVQITLRHASPGFDDQPLSDLPILPAHLWKDLPAGRLAPKGLPVGSGPYRLVRHRRGKSYRFRANRGYFRGRPRVETIDVPFISDFDATVRALEDRRVDMIPVTLPGSAQERLSESVFDTKVGSGYTGTTLMFNLRRPPFNRRAARRAVASALDLKRITRAANLRGTAAVAADRGYLHPRSAWAGSPVQRFERRRARSALAALDLPQIRVMAPNNDPVGLEAGRQVVLALERAGANAILEKLPSDRLAAAVGQDGASPKFEAAIWPSPALASFDPDFLRVVFGSRGAPINYSGYRSARFDRLAARVAAARSPRVRRRDAKSESRLLQRDTPAVPLFFRQGTFAYRPQIYDGWLYVKGTGILDKQSFLPSAAKDSAPGAAPRPAASREAEGGIGVLGIIALGLLGIALAVVAFGLAARRRPAND